MKNKIDAKPKRSDYKGCSNAENKYQVALHDWEVSKLYPFPHLTLNNEQAKKAVKEHANHFTKELFNTKNITTFRKMELKMQKLIFNLLKKI